MGFWDDVKGYAGETYDWVDKQLGGHLPGGVDPGDPSREGGEYAGVDRANFNLPGYDDMQGRYGHYLDEVDHRGAPRIASFQNAGQSGFRGQQNSLSDLLMSRAQGNNSVAEQQMKQGADIANQHQLAFAAGARPGNAAMAMRLAGQNMGANEMDLAGQTALARAQEANMAANSLGGVLAQGRGADENLNMFNAGQQNQRMSQNAQMQQQQYAINDAARNGLLGGSFNAAQAQQQGGQNYEQNRTARFGSVLGVPTNDEVLRGAEEGIFKALSGGGGMPGGGG